MSEKSIARNHATYLPRTPLARPAARSHATPTEYPVAPKPVIRNVRNQAHARPVATTPGMTRVSVRGLALALEALCPGAVLVFALSNAFVALVLGFSGLLQHTLHARIGVSIFPLLIGGIFLILARSQINIDSYWTLRKRVGLMTGHWTDHALTALYLVVLFFATAVIATLLATGAAAVVSVIFDW